MNTKSKMSALALAGLMAATSLGTITSVYAADAKKPAPVTDPTPTAVKTDVAAKDAVAKTTAVKNDDTIIATMDEAYAGLRKVRAARLAIFNGNPTAAKDMIQAATLDFNAAVINMPKYAVKTQKVAANGDEYIPFDSSLSLSEGFVPTEQKKATLKEANTHLAKGEHKEAVNILKAADIDVTVSAAFIPANASVKHIKDAATLVSDQKFYQANLALKAIEDSVLTEGYSVDALPPQGTQSS